VEYTDFGGGRHRVRNCRQSRLLAASAHCRGDTGLVLLGGQAAFVPPLSPPSGLYSSGHLGPTMDSGKSFEFLDFDFDPVPSGVGRHRGYLGYYIIRSLAFGQDVPRHILQCRPALSQLLMLNVMNLLGVSLGDLFCGLSLAGVVQAFIAVVSFCR
jgi:hypothetical protein